MKLTSLTSMLPLRSIIFPLALALKLAASCSSYAAQGQASSGRTPAPMPTPAPAVRAVFVWDLPQARDPFFPSRRVSPQAAGASTNVLVQPSGLLGQLELKYVSLGKERRLASINNVTVAAGEKALVRLNGQALLVECVEIREDAVLVRLEGSRELRALKLRRGL
jgi:hypothetical protein